ncbi:hypothetical protein [Comamonas endophytica]|uniref:Flagellar hook-length control protein FliK n=1 Tax=Comamonas endophytica TaxID=2949090 RepID=A0ABY6GDP2_9BURK|nr:MULTISPECIES: hypothetical protein [unclassified Acidovorax]MCD2512836.1 hypothetical protein [Acidovorax sp. D4N7]UYG52815.1 hypothetical protein M9799_06135 [Acidovorax sp. 5MLIR]
MPCERPLSLDRATPSGMAPDTPCGATSHAAPAPAAAAQVKSWREARARQRDPGEAPEAETLAMTGPFDLFQNTSASPTPKPAEGQAQAIGAAALQPQPGLSPGAQVQDGLPQDGLPQDGLLQDGLSQDGLSQDRLPQDRLSQDRLSQDRLPQDRLAEDGRPQPRPGLAQGTLPHLAPLQGALPGTGQPQDMPAEGMPVEGVPAEGVLPRMAPPPMGTPQIALSQGGLPQDGLPGDGLPQGGPSLNSLAQGALPQDLLHGGLPQGSPSETAQAELAAKALPKPWEMLSSAPMAGTPPQGMDRSQETAQPGNAGAPAEPAPADSSESSALVKPFDLFHSLPLARPAETADPTAVSAALESTLMQMATRLLVSDGSDGQRRVQIEIAEEQLPGVVVDVFEDEGRVVTRFTCSDEASRERLCSGAPWLADSLVERLQRDSRVQVQTNDPGDPRLLQIDANC